MGVLPMGCLALLVCGTWLHLSSGYMRLQNHCVLFREDSRPREPANGALQTTLSVLRVMLCNVF